MIVYATSIWNHYQAPLCYALEDLIGSKDFRAVMLRPKDDPISLPRIKLGWNIDPPKEAWIVPNPESSAQLNDSNREWIRLIADADVAILSALHHSKQLNKAVRRRILDGKLTFFVNERFFKDRLTFFDYINPFNWYRWWKLHIKYNLSNVHYLPISHFGQDDLKMLHTCKGRMWRWAYFPEITSEPPEKQRSDVLHIGWCGRMIPWKHVEVAIQAMADLPQEVKARCRLTIVGRGECEGALKQLCVELGLRDSVTFKPQMTVPEVAEFMRMLDVYLLPSDRGEGWGVVLAEAMNKCCVPIACEEAGATLELIQDGVNGFVHKKGDHDYVARQILKLYNDRVMLRNMSDSAFASIQGWSAKVGATRLLALIEALRSKSSIPFYKSGLCSRVG